MSVHCRNGIYIVRWRDYSGSQREQSFGRGEEGHRKALEMDALIKKQKEANKEAYRNAEVIASSVIPPSIPEQINLDKAQEEQPAIPFVQLVSEFLAHSQVNGSTYDHRRSIAYIAERFYFPHFGRATPINQITYGDILELMTKVENEVSQHGKKRSQVTINKYGHFLKAFFRYAVDLGYLDKNPMSRWKPKKTAPKQVKLTLEDFHKIIANAAPHLKWALEVEYHLGLRSGQSELLSLKWDDIDLDTGEAHIYASKTKTYRTIPINESFLDRLRERQNRSVTPYVVEYEGKPLKCLKRSFNRAVKLANITYPVRMYDVRHLFATTLIENGATIGAVSALLGHSRTSTTVNVYYHTTKAETVNAIGKLPALELN